jgi:hypothetical protein
MALLAAASGDAPVALAEEGAGPPGTDGGLADHPGRVAAAVAGAGVALLTAGGLADSRGDRAQEVRCAGVGKRLMSVPTSARIRCAWMYLAVDRRPHCTCGCLVPLVNLDAPRPEQWDVFGRNHPSATGSPCHATLSRPPIASKVAASTNASVHHHCR